MASQGFPDTYAAIRRMFRRTGLHTRMTRAIARNAGLRRRAGGESASGPRTILDTYFDPDINDPLYWQWTLDLSGYTRIRIDAMSHAQIYVWYSLLGPTATSLDPGDWTPMFGHFDEFVGPLADGDDYLYTNALAEQVGNPLYWMELKEEHKAPLRICFASETENLRIDNFLYSAPFLPYSTFNLALEAR